MEEGKEEKERGRGEAGEVRCSTEVREMGHYIFLFEWIFSI